MATRLAEIGLILPGMSASLKNELSMKAAEAAETALSGSENTGLPGFNCISVAIVRRLPTKIMPSFRVATGGHGDGF